MNHRMSIDTFKWSLIGLLIFLALAIGTSTIAEANDGIDPADSLFLYREIVTEPDPTMDELEALVDELSIVFDKFAVETFKQSSEYYAANDEQKETLSTGKDPTLRLNFNTFVDRCNGEFDDNNQLNSVKCDKFSPTPVEILYAHPKYEHIRVTVMWHNLSNTFKTDNDSKPSRITIEERYAFDDPEVERLRIETRTSYESLSILLNTPELECGVKSFEPFVISNYSPAFHCTIVLRETIAIFKRLTEK